MKRQPQAPEKQLTMSRSLGLALYVLALVAIIVGVDIVFFRHRFWPRLIVDVGIVLVFIAVHLRFLRSS